jgi:nucleotide-binding universal stress UspA family protein
MKSNSLRRWSRPKTILVVSDFSESPAHTLQVISAMRISGAKVVLVQLPFPAHAIWREGRELHGAPPANVPYRFTKATDQAFLWAEILSEVTVMRNTPIERISSLADSLAAEMVVLTKADIGRISFRKGTGLETDLFGSLEVPVLICGARSDMSSWNPHAAGKILVPVSFRPGIGLQMRFACRYARRHHGRVTVLHVFEKGNPISQPWERTPVTVEAQLPIAELKREGIMCPLEIAVCEGYADRKILAFNEQKPHDLIIMGGPRGRDSLQTFGRSVTEEVIAEARCPVLILGDAIMPDSAGLAELGSHRALAQNGQRGD